MARRKFDEGDVFRVAEGVYFEITDVGGGFVGGDIELEATPLFPEGYVELAIRELRRLERVPPEVWAAMCAANYAAMEARDRPHRASSVKRQHPSAHKDIAAGLAGGVL